MAWHQGQAYGQDLRDRVLGANGSIAEVAARFGVSKSYVSRARSRRRRLGEDTPGAQHNHLPPYSPDYNPIEQVFAKLKALLRKTAARTMEARWGAFGVLLNQFTPAECERYLRHADYGRSG